MQTFRTTTRRALVVAVLALGGLLMLGGGSAAGDGLLKPPQPCGGTRRGDIGEMQMERLPWNVHVLRADLSRDRPVAIAGFYVFDRHLIVVAQSGMVWCLDRFNLEPRWANMLSAPLFQPPAEGATHFTFLCKDYRGQYWLHAISKRSGEEGPDFPRRLGFAASSGVAANASMAFMGSLGAAHHNKTFESVNLVDGRGGWGYLAPGMVFAAPQMDAAGKNVVFTTDNGHVISLPAGALPPRGPNWDKTTGNNMKYGPGLSPEQVAGRLALENGRPVLSHETIYRFIYAQITRHNDYSWRYYLPRAKAKRGFRGRRGGSPANYIRQRLPLALRPVEALDRASPGHWEADLILFAKYGQAILSLHERASRILLAHRPANKTAPLIADSLHSIFAALPAELRQTVTFDNGSEFAHHFRLHDLDLKTFFCDPHAPWQKGGIENAIGRMRRFLPRKTDLATIDNDKFNTLITIYNHTPRKCLDFKTPAEVFFNQLLHFKCESTPP